MRERIKEIIEREGMSQGQFADYIGINRPTLSHVIAGRNNPSMDVVMKIHQHFPKANRTERQDRHPFPHQQCILKEEF